MMECKISTRTVGVFIVFNDRQYYNVSKYSSDEQKKSMSCREQKTLFALWIYTIHTKQRETSLYVTVCKPQLKSPH